MYRWCRQVGSVPANSLLESPLLQNFDLLILAIDADVASKTYLSANIQDPLCDDLPCEQACPPASDTTDRLEEVVEHWLSPVCTDSRTILCIPSKSIESWVAAALYAESDSGFADMIECSYDVLQYMHAKPARERLVSSSVTSRGQTPRLTVYPHTPRLVSSVNTEGQKRNRAFAAEFLAPADAIRKRLVARDVSQEDVDELACDMGVSPFVVHPQIVNHGLAAVNAD